MSRDAWDKFSKTMLVRYVLSYLCGTLYLDPSVSLKRIFAFSVGGGSFLSFKPCLNLPEYIYNNLHILMLPGSFLSILLKTDQIFSYDYLDLNGCEVK